MGLDDIIKTRMEKLKQLKERGINPYPHKFNRDTISTTLHDQFDNLLEPGEERRDTDYSLAGRIMLIRDFGKLMFLVLDDGFGRIQLCLKKGETPDETIKLVKKYLDEGDIIGVRGYVFKTKKGETTIMVKELVLLSKSLRPLPEKWHGLVDVEERYRKRYVDLIINPEVREVFIKRSIIIKTLRDYLWENQFLEVEVPIVQPVYGGAFAKPFKTYSNAWETEMYLSISPELYLKRLLVGGFDRVFTITKAFRNEDVDRTHNPEFTMMEAYASYWDYNDVMDFTEKLFLKIAEVLYEGTKIVYGDVEIDLSPPWKRLTMKDALKELAGLKVDDMDEQEMYRLLKEKGVDVEPRLSRGQLIAELFEVYCEDKLIQPTFIMDYPRETTPLCKSHRKDPKLVERFELYINGWEMANAYSELNDPILQRELFKQQEELRKKRGEYHPMDEDFVEALEYGMPPAGGLGIGIDRMVMLFTNSQSIRDVILFPQLRPKEKKNREQEK